MPKSATSPVLDRFTTLLKKTQLRIASPEPSVDPAQQVMSGFAEAYRSWFESLVTKPDTLMELQGRYAQDQMNLWMQAFQPVVPASPEAAQDKRFAAPEWSEFPLYRYYRDSYLLASKMMMSSVESAPMDATAKQRMRFFMRQLLDAAAPSNYLLTNPEALKVALETGGASLQEGMKNLLADIEKGHISMTDESAFEVGRNIANTKGAVVFQNELMQLIQYSPATKKVFERPLVMVPPCINKYYIMDLQRESSLVQYALDNGHTVFMVSWRNVTEEQGTLTWDDYVDKGVITALEAAKAITGADKVNALGFCIGGTQLACALAVLARKKKDFTASVTFMTTLLAFEDVGDIRVFLDKDFVALREKQLEKGGIVPGAQLAGSFVALRANDLVWSYVVNNYLKGKQPPAFDLLYWNADSTNLPGPMYAWYLRNTYQENNLVKPDALTMCGVPVDLRRIKVPAFVLTAREDHIVPWKSGYDGARSLGGPVKFVLGASGHIAGAINPASKNKRNYWANDKVAADADQWLAQAKEVPGSWWPEWAQWLKPKSGKLVAARTKLGDAKHKPIEPAPGSYVKVAA